MRLKFLIVVLVFYILNSHSQNDSAKIFRKRKILTTSIGVIGYGGSALLLNELWYKNYRSNNFRLFDDSEEWFQVDKFGHVFTCYQLGAVGISALKWSGVERNKAIWLGGLSGFAYMGVVELMDGYSEGWGYSWADLGSNAVGGIVLIAQEKIWKEQRIRMKFSYYPSEYAKLRPELLGDNELQKLFKDYNAQTYWMSINIHSFLKPESKFPRWLNIAVGAGGDGMTGGFENPEIKDANGNILQFERKRQIYFSLDADLSRIQTKSRVLRKVLDALNCIKIPFPSLEFNGSKTLISIQ
jgi:hypothetical protein